MQSAYKQFQGKPVAILINTQAMNKGVKFHPDHYGEGITYFDVDSATQYINSGADGPGEDSEVYVNYNAILSFEDATFGLKSGVYEFTGAFHIEEATGKVIFDSHITGFTKPGNSEYISPSAKFDANLIKDSSGTIVGVVFKQLAR